MCGKAYDPSLIAAWPSANIAVMGGDQAAKVLLQIQAATMKSKGQELSDEDQEKLLSEIRNKYDSQMSPYYAASRLWVDNVIDPLETRKWVSMGIEAADQFGERPKYNVGVLQT